MIYFGTGNGHLLEDMAPLADVLAFDWRTPLVESWDRLNCKAVQGNLDPIVLCADSDTVTEHAARLLDDVAASPSANVR